MKRGICTIIVLAVFVASVISAYSTTVNLNTLHDKEVQVYFIENSNQAIQVLNYLNLKSNSSGDVTFGYIGKNPSFSTLIAVVQESGALIYLLDFNKDNKGLLEVYNFNLSSMNQVQEKSNQFLFHFLKDFSNSSSNETAINNSSVEIPQKQEQGLLQNKYTYLVLLILIALIIFFVVKMSSKKKSSEEEYDPFNPHKPVKLYQQENALVRSAKQKLKEVSSDIKRLKDSQEKALKLRKEMIQRERELSKVKA